MREGQKCGDTGENHLGNQRHTPPVLDENTLVENVDGTTAIATKPHLYWLELRSSLADQAVYCAR